MSNIKTKLTEKYLKSMSDLHSIGAEYVQKSADNQKAQDNLYKVYHAYSVGSVVVAYGLLIAAVIGILVFHAYAWIIALPFALILPKSFQWSMQNVLNILPSDYYEWKTSKKNKA